MEGWWAASYAVLWVLVGVLAVMVVALARQIGTLHLRLGPRGALEMDDEGPPLGEAPEPVNALDLDGRAVPVGGPGDPQLLVFVSPTCPICREVVPGVAAAARAGRLVPRLIVEGSSHDAAGAYASVRAPTVVSPDLARAYAVPGTPYAVVLDRMGVVRAKGTINNLEQLEGLVDTGTRRTAEATAAIAGGAD